jgi:hypothetical protein
MPDTLLPRGVRNHNPGNIRESQGDRTRWLGERATDDDPAFEEFQTPEMGFRALALVLLSYRRRGITRLNKILATYAPASENDTDSYVRHVAELLGVAPDDDVDVGNPDTLALLLRAISRHENGVRSDGTDWWTDAQIAEGVRLLALNR